MANKIEEQVESLFSEREQWESFLELREQKDALRNAWWQGFLAKMNRHFAVDNKADGWDYVSYSVWDCRWYLTEFGTDSLCVWCGDWTKEEEEYRLGLWADPAKFNVVKIANVLQETKYTPILSAFERIDIVCEKTHDCKIVENGNFSFGSPDDGNLNADTLAWYAHYQPEAFLSQISRKVDRFRKDPEVSALLAEINRETKKQ